MVVYLIRASEWETEVDCVCATKEIAKRERRRLAESYGLEDDEIEEFIEIIEMDLIDK